MTVAEFSSLLPKLSPYTQYLYFHLMGEPLLHPDLDAFLSIAGESGFRVILTTNGSLLAKRQNLILDSPAVHKINVSLHAFEANDLDVSFDKYLNGCIQFGKAAEGKKIVVYRLWNGGGADQMNASILHSLHQAFPGEWPQSSKGITIGDKIFLEHGDKFDWPDLSAEDGGESVFCYGLRDQIGVLCDGTVVPCCLDHEGDIPLGNLFNQELGEILDSPRAKAIYNGFTCRTATEELCRKCGYARRFG